MNKILSQIGWGRLNLLSDLIWVCSIINNFLLHVLTTVPILWRSTLFTLTFVLFEKIFIILILIIEMVVVFKLIRFLVFLFIIIDILINEILKFCINLILVFYKNIVGQIKFFIIEIFQSGLAIRLIFIIIGMFAAPLFLLKCQWINRHFSFFIFQFIYFILILMNRLLIIIIVVI